MDDCCAVCAEPLEWVAYGPCLHREVCSTCVARLRFICDNRCCCICKTECNHVFVTKALGDYTKMINDFAALPSEVREGKIGSYWYHEDTNAFFDDVDHYKMIKAMCRLSCSICDKTDEQPQGSASRRREQFKNIGQLKGHIFHRHKLHMCSLCLEGRKVFICEQKLYTRAQLNQHISTGDSEVDGSESERGGFMGHPICEYCRTRFYGDNELYVHMSTEHYTCHICQRQHTGQYDYFKNYDDLEIHFRKEHFLCEDEACLAKKFVVFQSEAEMKKHNAIEHGGRMSRSKRNAALQIPTSFRYRHGNEQEQRRGRNRSFRRDFTENHENQLAMAIEASLETANVEQTFRNQSASGSRQVAVDDGNGDIDSLIQPFESLAVAGSEASSRYLQALGHSSRSGPLEDSSFPPLPITSNNGHQGSKQEVEGSSSNSMAARLRHHNNRTVTVINSGNAWPAAGRGLVQPASNPSQFRQSSNNALGLSRNSGQTKKTVINSGLSPSTYAGSIQSTQRTSRGHLPGGSSRDTRDNVRIVHSASAPNLMENNSVEASLSDFPPVSAAQASKIAASSHSSLNVENVQSANQSLVEKIRRALDFDEERYSMFKDISAQYGQGTIDTETYMDYVQNFGLSRLVLELARSCPDTQKRAELVSASLQRDVLLENNLVQSSTSTHRKDSNVNKKGKGKSVDSRGSNPTEKLADNFLSTVHQLQANYKSSEEKVEVLSRDDYRSDRGKLKIEQRTDTNSGSQPAVKLSGKTETSNGSLSTQVREDGGGGNKQRKKGSKFLRVRLGDGSASALFDQPDLGKTDHSEVNDEPGGGPPVRGVWRKGGGHKLFP
ncbi:E3 ubiquitin-protein ligase ZNF598 [Vigna radiata var. radiata]|uniref:RING-type E3 ubiquitin transferase n=1 Tax=Vigna radiata var. radiata TaxID=3916 RepID=A0A1S3TQI5_VIGRR|nr:E3 ubiquitin-protein ligase ZNF598 [Vigna radiata var. radiata]